MAELTNERRNAAEYWNAMHDRINYRRENIRTDDWLERFDYALRESEKPVMDLGCGGGNNTLYLVEHGKKVVACDFSGNAIERIRENFPENVETRCFDMLDGFEFAQESFDLIIADLCLHYFRKEDTERILRDLKRLLVPGGRLIGRVNSVNDVNHGAGQGTEIEKHLFVTEDGRFKRFFDGEDLKFFFRDFETEYMKEDIMTRYKLEKRLYVFCVRKNKE